MQSHPAARIMQAPVSRSLRASRANTAARRGWLALVAAVSIPLATGCDVSTARHDFRGAASNGIETGVRALLGGVIDGAFAVFDTGTSASGGPSGSLTSNSSSGSSTSTNGSNSTAAATP